MNSKYLVSQEFFIQYAEHLTICRGAGDSSSEESKILEILGANILILSFNFHFSSDRSIMCLPTLCPSNAPSTHVQCTLGGPIASA